MTPDQIFKAEQKLRELKKIETALASWTEFVFGATLESVKGPAADFPISNSDLSVLLKDAASEKLRARAVALHNELHEMGVEL